MICGETIIALYFRPPARLGFAPDPRQRAIFA
jgi:hypothetical protein